MQKKISILKCPKFWRNQTDELNLRTKSIGERVNYEVKCGYLYDYDCKTFNFKNECNRICEYKTPCKLYLMNIDEGVGGIKRNCKNAKLPITGTGGAAGYDLTAAQAAAVPAHGKVLVKIGLSMTLSPGCYRRVAPRSGLALKKFVGVGVRVIDFDYRGNWV